MKKFVLSLLILTYSLYAFAQKQRLKVVYIGDSITQGVQLSDPSAASPPAAASKYLKSQVAVDDIVYSNQGHSGFTTVDFLPSGETFKQAEQAANTLAGPGQLIFSIMLGTNDSAIKGPNGSPVSPEAYFTNMKLIADQLLKDYPGCTIVIHLPTWYSPNTYNGAEYLQAGLDRLQSYFPQIRKLVKSYGKTKRVFLGDTKAFAYFKSNHLTDLIPEPGHQGTFYLHPNASGAAVLGTFWGRAIYKIININ